MFSALTESARNTLTDQILLRETESLKDLPVINSRCYAKLAAEISATFPNENFNDSFT